MVIEVELRSFVSKEKYQELLGYFKKNGRLESVDNQTTYYLSDKVDLRIQKNDFFSKIWLKRGSIHDEQREEVEVHFDKLDFEKLVSIFSNAGFEPKIKWVRRRHTFKWKGVNVMVDNTAGYGYIIEIEKVVDERKKDIVLGLLRSRFEYLGIDITPREEFESRYSHYKKNWKKLSKDK